MVSELASVSNIIYSIFADLQVVCVSGKDAALVANVMDRLRGCQQEIERIKARLAEETKAEETKDVGNT